jgi:heme O synthase-like polyprenyltransferase
VLDAWFVWSVIELVRQRTNAAARRAFLVSLAYLFALFAAMFADLALRA